MYGMRLGALICVGISAVIVWQTIINVGMNLSLLPVIGIGFILIPWAVISLFQGNRLLGFGLLLLYLAINLLRSLLEPKLVGKSIGLPPLVTLLSIYAGLQLFGIAGLLMPCLVLAALFFYQKYRQIKKEEEP